MPGGARAILMPRECPPPRRLIADCVPSVRPRAQFAATPARPRLRVLDFGEFESGRGPRFFSPFF